MAYLSESLLAQAWDDLNDRIVKINIPKAMWHKGLHGQFENAFNAWSDRRNAKHDERGQLVRPFTVLDLEQWSASLAQQQANVATLEATYPQLTSAGPDPAARQIKDEKIKGALPWWYWPVRIGAGVGAGYFIFRVLRPTESTTSFQPAFAGLGVAPINAEGMTWNEWRYAAGKAKITDSAERKVLKRAWQEGEDPSDWRKYFADKSYAESTR